MARGRGAKQYFTFVKGWNTEAAPTTFPENTAQDLDNVILDVDGSIRRRPGIDFEASYARYGLGFSPSEATTNALGFYEWNNVGGSGSLTFAVAQQGINLYIKQMNGDATSATNVGSIDMTPYAINVAGAKKSVIQVASGQGVLFVCGRYIEPFYISWDGTTLTTTEVSIMIRDFEGDPQDTLATEERPLTLSDTHKYNLLNQGWDAARINAMATGGTVASSSFSIYGFDVLSIFATASGSSGVFPSNADIVYLGMTTNSNGDPVFKASELKGNDFGNTPAPKGHYILNAFSQDRSSVSGIVGCTNTLIPTRPETVAFHNGRVFWAGIFAQGVTGNIYYSQQLTNVDKAGRCYQIQDPTADQLNDLLATDGGLVVIPNAGQVMAIKESPNGIVVFAGNGIWEIGGSQGKFSATDVAVTKVTEISCISGESVIEADGIFMYWSDSGIIGLSPDQITGMLTATNLTKNTIQTGYQLIGGINRRFARGVYITEEKKAVWIYNTSTTSNGTDDRWKCNGVLIFDTQLGAWYKYSITDTIFDYNYICGIIKSNPFTSGIVTESVTVDGVDVTVSAVTVTVGSENFTGGDISSWKLLTVIGSHASLGNYDFTLSEFYSRSFMDWFKVDGTGYNYTSFIETGYDMQGNAMQDKQPTYLFAYFSPLSKSLSSGGYYELPPLITYSSGFRTTQAAVETLVRGDTADVRVTQVVVETLISS